MKFVLLITLAWCAFSFGHCHFLINQDGGYSLRSLTVKDSLIIGDSSFNEYEERLNRISQYFEFEPQAAKFDLNSNLFGEFSSISASSFTFEMWFSTTKTNSTLFSIQSGTTQSLSISIQKSMVRVVVSSKLFPLYFSNDFDLFDSDWHHIAIVFEGNAVSTFLLDLVEVDLYPSFSAATLQLNGVFSVGHAQYGGELKGLESGNSFSGFMDELRFWGCSRTVAEIQSAAFEELDGAEPGLLLYLPFRNGSFEDASGHVTVTNGVDANWAVLKGPVSPLCCRTRIPGHCDLPLSDREKALAQEAQETRAILRYLLEKSARDYFVEERVLYVPRHSFAHVNPLDNSLGRFPTTALTLEFWAYVEEHGRELFPFSYAAGSITNALMISFRQDYSPSTLAFNVCSRNVQIDFPYSPGWAHFAFSWTSSGGTVRFYQNGSFLGSRAVASGLSLPAGGAVVLGMDQDAVMGLFVDGEDFSGALTEVRLWNTVRTQAEILTHMNTRLPTELHDSSDLAIYWPLNDGFGPVAEDRSAQHNTLSLAATGKYGPARWQKCSAFSPKLGDCVLVF
eukprot:GCRY01003211.1.p1 GENE.GCRY01003211.1~~GCRY01003211.1.p1  ORF type:complete len:565 (-),score=97.74 GCRY01003211.1:437-2131(-)